VLPKGDRVSVGLISSRLIANGGPRPDPEAMLEGAIGELRAINALPRQLGPALGPVAGWQLPVAAALELESHVGKRSLAVGLAGGFVAALSGQWLYPTIAAAAVAAGVVRRAIADPRPQDVLAQFGARWRGEFADYLRSPNTRLAFLLPLAFGNPHIAARFSRAYLFGETF
jgi:flavin-dependent dehydrogenase